MIAPEREEGGVSSAPQAQTAIVPMISVRRPRRFHRAPKPEHRDRARQVGNEDRAEQGRRQVEWRRREHEVHIGEQRDEVEQRAEADRVDREQPRLRRWPSICRAEAAKSLGAHEVALARQQHAGDNAASEGQRRRRR